MLTKLYLVALLCIPGLLLAQFPADCEGDRYVEYLYDETSMEIDTVSFGHNADAFGKEYDLEMLVVHNPDDTILKPVVVYAFGGGFVLGQKESMIPFCIEAAGRGMVAVSIDYRLWPLEQGQPDGLEITDANVKTVADMKAAVRKIRHLADMGNPYNMDPDRVLVGGASAGAFTALHHAYLNAEDEEAPEYLFDLVDSNGGWEGDSGFSETEGYSSEVQGVINFSGALYDSIFLDAGEPPLFSMHGDADETVPFGNGNALGLIPVHGSSSIHHRALDVGLFSKFLAVEGGGHSDIYSDPEYAADREMAFALMDTFYLKVLCDVDFSAAVELSFGKLQISPNPAHDYIDIALPQGHFDVLDIYNAFGQNVLHLKIDPAIPRQRILTDELTANMYYVRLKNSRSGEMARGKFILNK